MKIEIEVKSVKSLQEKVHVAIDACLDMAARTGTPAYRHSSYALEDLLGELSKHRPVGRDGVHGSLHTATCGCEDNPGPRGAEKIYPYGSCAKCGAKEAVHDMNLLAGVWYCSTHTPRVNGKITVTTIRED